MSYYSNPNYYSNYPQYGTYGNQYIASPQIPQQSQMNITQQMPQQTINGKIVDSIDMVKVSEVPIGSYGVFPKADLSEIYIKSWNNNGTTNIVAFKPVFPDAAQQKTENDINSKILEKVSILEEKMNNFLQSNTSQNLQQQQVVDAAAAQTNPQLRKEVNLNAY